MRIQIQNNNGTYPNRFKLTIWSTNGRHEVVDGTDHMSKLQNEATADHILSIVEVGL